MSNAAAKVLDLPSDAAGATAFDYAAYVHEEEGRQELDLLVEGIHCAGCVAKIERALAGEPDLAEGRVNLTTKRLHLAWMGPVARANALTAKVMALGYKLTPFDAGAALDADEQQEKELLRCLAVAGFAAANVMLLSVSVWAGHFQGMGEATRTLLHWFSALVALPAVIYAGRPFFKPAWAALKGFNLVMEVPISLAVILASAMSLYQTMQGGQHAYFDSAISLLFFLLIGRYLDRRARGRARSAATRLLALASKPVTVLSCCGKRRFLPANEVSAGATVLVAAGERIGVDARVREGISDVDQSVITGESLPVTVQPGARVFAGAVNISTPLTLEVTATGKSTLLGEMIRLMEAAEQRKSGYVSLADRISKAYAPAVHLLALVTFVGWFGFSAIGWEASLMHAIAVLIITCPCALGLAVPVVQVIASGKLMKDGILLKSGTALERVRAADTVVFDKTGTLTLGQLEIVEQPQENEALLLAAGLAAKSRHPLSRALAALVPEVTPLDGVKELPGRGLLWEGPEGEVRLGSRAWLGLDESDEADAEIWLARPGKDPVRFAFADELRPDSAEVIAALQARGYRIELLSGDRPAAVAATARSAGIDCWSAALTPEGKTQRLEALEREGRQVLMVGDGLNDAPALSAASVSLSPASAADISQTASDIVFQGESLKPILRVLDLSKSTNRLVKENFALAFGYNFVTIPLAMAGFVTPLIAALAMSGSSIAVILNAMRLMRR